MIPLIEEEVVNKHRWVEKEEMLDLIAIAQSCPGVFAINIAIFIGLVPLLPLWVLPYPRF